jgi:hypothetical protein
MTKHKYRVYLAGSRTIDVIFECTAPSEGELALRTQYGCEVTWMGSL